MPTEKLHAHSFFLGAEVGIQYTCIDLKNSGDREFELDIDTSPLSQEFVLSQIQVQIRDKSLG